MRAIVRRTGSILDAVDLTSINSRLSFEAWLARGPVLRLCFFISSKVFLLTLVGDKACVMCWCLCRVNWELCGRCVPDVRTIIGAVLRSNDSCHHANDCFAAPSGTTGCTSQLFRWVDFSSFVYTEHNEERNSWFRCWMQRWSMGNCSRHNGSFRFHYYGVRS